MKSLTSYSTAGAHIHQKPTWTSRFLTWCHNQEENRLAWLAIAIAGHGCLFTPITLLFIMLTGNHTIFWPFAIAAMTMSVVVNLAAMPTKITIPIFLLSLIIDLYIIVNCLALGFNIPGTA
jgi:hypothetical protein